MIDSTFPPDVQKKILPENNGQVFRNFIIYDKNDNLFLSQAEKDIDKICVNYVNLLNLYQESYFLYDRSNVAKQSFVKELNQSLPIYCLVCFFVKKKTDKMRLISPKNSQSFFVEREQIDLQITKISGEKLGATDKKIHEVFISRIEKK